MKTNLIIIFFLLSFILSGCGDSIESGDSVYEVVFENASLEICPNLPQSREQCFKDLGFLAGNPHICAWDTNNSISTGQRDYCYWGIAIRKKDLTFCEDIEYYESYYKWECYVDVVAEKKDYSLCNNIFKDVFESRIDRLASCYTNVAVAMKDLLVCDKMWDFVSDKLSKRDFSPNNFFLGLASCYSEVAVAMNDSLVCDKMRDFVYGKFPNNDFSPEKLNNCFLKVAIAKNDFDYCDTLEPDTMIYCYKQIAAKNKNFSICDRFKDDELIRSLGFTDVRNLRYKGYYTCYLSVSRAAGIDLNLVLDDYDAQIANCYYVPQGANHASNWVDFCFVGLAKKLNDPSLCPLSEGSMGISTLDQCYEYFVNKILKESSENIPSICGDLLNYDMSDVCYMTLIRMQEDATWCKKQFPHLCESDYNYSCDLLVNKDRKSKCIRSYS